MLLYLDDTTCKDALQPFSLTRHIADIRIGILTIREKWERLLHVQDKIQLTNDVLAENVFMVPANIIPTKDNFEWLIKKAQIEKVIVDTDNLHKIQYPWDIYKQNDWAIRKDFEIITADRKSQKIDPSNKTQNENDIFIEGGASVMHCFLNASNGPIYIGKNAQIMEGSMIRGPFALGENAVVKMGATIYGATTIGPFCVAGGEIKNSVMMAYSNKAHHGYLGDSVIGEWCNLGAGTTNSNVKNTAGDVFYTLHTNQTPINVGNKAGLIMGDYSRAAINTSFNTGTIVGICCNVFEQGFPPTYIPNFRWGNERYQFEKAIRDIENWMRLKNRQLTTEQITTLTSLYQTEN